MQRSGWMRVLGWDLGVKSATLGYQILGMYLLSLHSNKFYDLHKNFTRQERFIDYWSIVGQLPLTENYHIVTPTSCSKCPTFSLRLSQCPDSLLLITSVHFVWDLLTSSFGPTSLQKPVLFKPSMLFSSLNP